MTLQFTGIGVASAASGTAPTYITTTAAMAAGDFVVAVMAYDNSGGGGADPLTALTISCGIAGTVGASATTTQAGLNDPGAASAGIAVRVAVYPVIGSIPSGTTSLAVSWTGTAVARAIAVMKVSSSSGGTVGYRTNSGAGVVNGALSTTFLVGPPAVTSTEGFLCWCGYESGEAVVGDTDTINGNWTSIYGTFQGSAGLTGIAAYMQAKTVTGSNTQTWNVSGATSSWWVGGTLVFTETLPVAVTQAAYQAFQQGFENNSLTLAAINTAPTIDIGMYEQYIHLRLRLQSTTATVIPATDDWQLQYEQNGGGTWVNVTSASALVSGYPGESVVVEGQATTNRLGAGTGSYVAGEVSIDGLVDDLGWTGNNYTEILYSIIVWQAGVSNGDTFRFRVLRNGVTTTMTYTAVPTVNVIRTPQNITATILTNWGTWTGTFTGNVSAKGTIATNWGTWTGTANGSVFKIITGTIATVWNPLDRLILQDVPLATTAPGLYTLGIGFTPTVTGRVTHLRYWCQTAGTHTASLWHLVSQAKLASVVDAGATQGWRELLLPTSVQVSAGVSYIASFTSDGAAAGSDGASVPPTAASPRLTLDYAYYITGTDVFPDIISNGHYFADVRFMAAWTTVGTVAIPATGAQAWGTWTGTFTAVKTVLSVFSGTWGTWIPNFTAVVTIPATAVQAWGTWAGTITGVATAGFTDVAATAATNWGTWNTAVIATRDRPATGAQNWGTWTAASVVGTVTIPATAVQSWGTWAGTFTGTRDRPAAIAQSWGTWAATFTAVVNIPATIASNWSGPWSPTDVAGLAVWLEADALALAHDAAVSSWPNPGSGPDPTFVTPYPVFKTSSSTTPSGKPVVHFAINEGHLRMTGTGVSYVFTLIYVARLVSGSARVVTSIYPTGGNFLIGYHGGLMDAAYDGTFWSPAGSTNDGSWKLYSADKVGSGQTSRLFIDGTYYSTGSGTDGFGGTLAISGYDPTGTQETGTIDFAGALFYDNKIADTDRQFAEQYMRAKYLGVGSLPVSKGWNAVATGTATAGEIFATAAQNWGTWTGAFTATRGQPAAIAQNYGTWTGTFTGTRGQPAAIAQNYGTWVTAFTATIEIPATASTTAWGTWAGTITAQAIGHPATIATNWGTCTGLAGGRRTSEWSATASTTTDVGFVNVPGTIDTNWGTWAGTFTGNVSAKGTIATNWGTWAGTFTGTRGQPAAIATNWGTWAGTITGTRDQPAAIATNWGTWAGTITGNVGGFATVATNWGTWTTSVPVVIEHPVVLVAGWGTWAAFANGIPSKVGAIATNWGTWTSSFTAQAIEHPATVATNWGTWITSVTATRDQPAAIATNWGTWAGVANGAQAGVVQGSIATNWGTWTSSVTALALEHPATIATNWGTWTATFTATRGQPATGAVNWGTWAGTITIVIEHPVVMTAGWGTWVGLATGSLERFAFIATNWGTWTALAIGQQVGVVQAAIASNWSPLGYGPQQRVVDQATVPSSTGAGNYTLGLRFTPGVAGRITHYRYFYIGGFSEPISNPRIFSVWTVADGIRRTSQTWNVTDPTTSYWVEVPLATPFILAAGTGYTISVHTASYGYGSFFPLTSMAPGISAAEGFYAGGEQFPASSAGGYHYLMDMVFEEYGVPVGWLTTASATLTKINTVDDLISALTDQTEVSHLAQFVDTSISCSTSDLDALRVATTVDTSIAATADTTDLVKRLETVDTSISASTTESEYGHEIYETLINGVTQVTDDTAGAQTLDTSLLATTTLVEQARFLETVDTSSACTTDQAVYEHAGVLTTISATADTVEVVRGAATLDSGLSGTTEIVERAGLLEAFNNDIAGITTLVELGRFYLTVDTSINLISDLSESGGNFELLDTSISCTSTPLDVVRYSQTLDTFIVGTTDTVHGVHFPQTLDTSIAATTTTTDLGRFVDPLDTTLTGTLTLSDLGRFVDPLTCYISAVTDQVESGGKFEVLDTFISCTATLVEAIHTGMTLDTIITESDTAVYVVHAVVLLDTLCACTSELTDIGWFKELAVIYVDAITSIGEQAVTSVKLNESWGIKYELQPA